MLKHPKNRQNQDGFTLVEMVTALSVFAIIAVSILGLYVTLISSTVVMKQKSIAISLATNQIEYIKALPYSNLAVSGGSIYSPNPIPANVNKTVNKFNYNIKTSINYVDDAFDGCGSYPNQSLKQKYCRNYPPPTGAPAVDSNAQDYKVVHVTVQGKGGTTLAEVDTHISAKVAETASTTGALFVSIIDSNGNPVGGANARVQNTSVTPNIDLNDTTDSNGVAIFYGLPPDTSGLDYAVTGSKSGYSTLKTILPSGSLQPTYPNVQLFSQQSSYVTLTIKPQGSNSLLVETTDAAGTTLSNVKVYAKGGYKSYTLATNTAYYYDTMSPSDTRPTTDGAGMVSVNHLVPGNYIFCGDLGATSCTRNGATQYLVAAIPYTGGNSLNPINVPIQTTPGDPGTSLIFGSSSYLQKVRLMFSTSSTHPRVFSMEPDNLSLGTTPLNNFTFQIKGVNLPCASSAASCATQVALIKNSVTYPASCTGNSTGQTINCTSNLTGISAGMAQLRVVANSQTLLLPVTPLLGGLSVEP